MKRGKIIGFIFQIDFLQKVSDRIILPLEYRIANGVLKTCRHCEYDGFLLSAYDKADEFFEITRKSLDVLKCVDGRRYRRVKKYLLRIALVGLAPGGHYVHGVKAFFVKDVPHDVVYFASALIHEATHGLLRTKGLYREREKHECLCVKEQLAFIRKFILSKEGLSDEQKKEWLAQYDKFFKDALISQWWLPKIQRAEIINQFKQRIFGGRDIFFYFKHPQKREGQRLKRGGPMDAFKGFHQWVSVQFYNLLLKFSHQKEHDGFILYAMTHEEEFFDTVTRALAIIKETDNRRYQRVKKYIQSFAYLRVGVSGYEEKLRSFIVDKFSGNVETFSALIIHEATHGYLLSKGFQYKMSIEKHERICIREQFLSYKRSISNKDLTKKEKEEKIANYRAYLDHAIKQRWWEEKYQRDKKINRLKAFLFKEYLHRTHYPNGKLSSECKIVNGRRHGFYKIFYENGALKDEGHFINGQRQGVRKNYNQDGVLESEILYANGKEDGRCKYYHQNGVLETEGCYRNGRLVGLWRWYDEAGNVTSEEDYKSGDFAVEEEGLS